MRYSKRCRDIDDIDARILLQHVLDVSHAHLVAHAEQALDSEQAQSFRLLAARRARGEPVAYLIGKREFYSLGFTVTPAVLIPRPETELLVDLALERIPLDLPWKILDLGTGSGAIALTIAKHRPLADIWQWISPRMPLAVAKINAANSMSIMCASSKLTGSATLTVKDSISSCPIPLILQMAILISLEAICALNPHLALAAENEGLDCIRSIIASCSRSPGRRWSAVAGTWL